MESGLAVPLTMTQIETANRLHGKLIQWQVTDRALHTLQETLPGFDIEATLLKVAAINQLYGANVYAVVRMAQHVTEVMQDVSGMEDVDLVEELGSLGGKKHISFASKFAHFFIDTERFPIFDSVAFGMIKIHLGRDACIEDKDHEYSAYFKNLNCLRRRAQLPLSYTFEDLDRYLWLAGLYRDWKTKPDPKINREVEELFKSLSANGVPISPLSEMLPSEFDKLKRRKLRVKKDKK